MDTIVAELKRESLVRDLVEGLAEIQKNSINLLACL